jgi:23S rRNA pseudouridine955/2504/2580 synthase
MIPVLARTPDLIVVDKAQGVSVQPGEKAGRCLVDLLEAQLGFRPHPIHRLDRETSGAIALAADSKAAGRWSKALESGSMSKIYAAFCAGRPERDGGTIDDDIVQRGELKPALTRYRLFRTRELADPGAGGTAVSLLGIRIGTGRTHQIRIHLAGIGLPILGDDRHGKFRLNKAVAKAYGAKRLMLHALRLEIRGAGPGGAALVATAPWPERFRSFAVAIGIDLPPEEETRGD